MSIKSRYKLAKERRKKSRAESKAFKQIIAKKALAARRRSYASAAIKRAEREGQNLANKPTISQRISSGLNSYARSQQKRQRSSSNSKRKKRRKKPQSSLPTQIYSGYQQNQERSPWDGLL